MDMMKSAALGLLVGVLAGCGGAGDVVGFFADRGHSVEREDTNREVVTRARATAFDSETRISTRGQAEVIYRAGGWGQRADRENFVADALERAKAVSRCGTATHTHSQDSLQGIHVMIALSNCPQLMRDRWADGQS